MILVIFILCQMALAMCGETRQSIEAKKNETCLLPKDVGTGKAKMPRFYFNATTSKCELFTFGGGKGNANNFFTKEECEEKCSDQGQNPTSQPPTTQKPKKNKICFLPKVTGLLFIKMRRYYYNATEGKCKKFVFGGVKGNANNFRSMEECEEKCGDSTKNSTSRPPPTTTGPPSTNQTTTSQPITIQPSGNQSTTSPPTIEPITIQPSGNQSTTSSPTIEPITIQPSGDQSTPSQSTTSQPTTISATTSQPTTSKPTQSEICSLPKMVGPGRARMPRFYYDAIAKKCKKFIFGGKKGNKNNFLSKRECEEKCGGLADD